MTRKHNQRPDKNMMVCPSCKKGDCNNCVDVLRTVYSQELICQCTRQGHSGEMNLEQIKDPFNNTVYGPHAVIKEDGTVITDEDSGKSSSVDECPSPLGTICKDPTCPVHFTVSQGCGLCGNPLDKDDPTNWKQVVGWVGGPKKDHMRLREDTGLLAHDTCVQKLAQGQAPDQPSIFDDLDSESTSGEAQLPEEL